MLTAVIENVGSDALNAKKERGAEGITVKQINVPKTVIILLQIFSYSKYKSAAT